MSISCLCLAFLLTHKSLSEQKVDNKRFIRSLRFNWVIIYYSCETHDVESNYDYNYVLQISADQKSNNLVNWKQLAWLMVITLK